MWLNLLLGNRMKHENVTEQMEALSTEIEQIKTSLSSEIEEVKTSLSSEIDNTKSSLLTELEVNKEHAGVKSPYF